MPHSKMTSLQRAVLACLISLTLTGCETLGARRLAAANDAAAAQAVTAVAQWIPPDACFVQRDHVALVAGDEARAVIVRERAIVDRLNDDKRLCRLNYLAYQNVRKAQK